MRAVETFWKTRGIPMSSCSPSSPRAPLVERRVRRYWMLPIAITFASFAVQARRDGVAVGGARRVRYVRRAGCAAGASASQLGVVRCHLAAVAPAIIDQFRPNGGNLGDSGASGLRSRPRCRDSSTGPGSSPGSARRRRSSPARVSERVRRARPRTIPLVLRSWSRDCARVPQAIGSRARSTSSLCRHDRVAVGSASSANR